jgi:hypothetical protein
VNLIQQCQSVMVPTKTLATLVKPFCSHVVVEPSTVHADWFFGQAQKRPNFPVVACVGNFDWSIILPTLLEALKEHQQVMVATTNIQLYNDLPEKRRMFVGGDVTLYARLMRTVYLALMPGERRDIDPGPIHEFGLFGVPSIVGPAWAEDVRHGVNGLVAGSPQSFRRAFDLLTTKDAVRGRLGSAAVVAAREHTAVRRADRWYSAVAKLCPSAAVSTTL